MLFFRSEEHLNNWPQFDSKTREGVITLPDLVRLFSGNYFKRRMDPDYVSNMRRYGAEFINELKSIKTIRAFWQL